MEKYMASRILKILNAVKLLVEIQVLSEKHFIKHDTTIVTSIRHFIKYDNSSDL
jgi:hypothetical protein